MVINFLADRDWRGGGVAGFNARQLVCRQTGFLEDGAVPLDLKALGELRTTLLDNATAGEDVHKLRLHVIEDALVMRDHQGAHAALLDERVDAGGDYAQGVDVETGIGFVEDGDVGAQHRHLEDFNALFLAAGKALVEVALHERLVDVEQRHCLAQLAEELFDGDGLGCVGVVLTPGIGHAGVGVDGGAQEVGDAHARHSLGVLKGEEQPAARAFIDVHGQDVLAAKGHRTAGDLVLGVPHDGVAQGAFPRAIGAHEPGVLRPRGR